MSDMERSPLAGRIFPEYWILCARCPIEKNTGARSRKTAHDVVVAWGWKKNITNGWHCPSCVKELEAERGSR